MRIARRDGRQSVCIGGTQLERIPLGLIIATAKQDVSVTRKAGGEYVSPWLAKITLPVSLSPAGEIPAF